MGAMYSNCDEYIRRHFCDCCQEGRSSTAAVAKLNWELANFLLKKANMNKFLAFGRKVVDENV